MHHGKVSTITETRMVARRNNCEEKKLCVFKRPHAEKKSEIGLTEIPHPPISCGPGRQKRANISSPDGRQADQSSHPLLPAKRLLSIRAAFQRGGPSGEG